MSNRIIFTLALLAYAFAGKSQSLSFSSGIGINTYFQIPNFGDYYDDYQYSFTSGSSYYAKLDFNDVKGSAILSNFSVRIDRNSGTFNEAIPYECFCGIGVPYNFYGLDQILINRTSISVSSYPLSIKLGEFFRLKSGIEFSKVITHDLRNTNLDPNDVISNREALSSSFTQEMEMKTYGVNALVELQFGRIRLNNLVTIYPTYNASLGLTGDFKNLNRTNSIRQNIGIGIEVGI